MSRELGAFKSLFAARSLIAHIFETGIILANRISRRSRSESAGKNAPLEKARHEGSLSSLASTTKSCHPEAAQERDLTQLVQRHESDLGHFKREQRPFTSVISQSHRKVPLSSAFSVRDRDDIDFLFHCWQPQLVGYPFAFSDRVDKIRGNVF